MNSELRQLISNETRLLEIAVDNATNFTWADKPVLAQVWGKEADRLAARICAFELVIALRI